jgi:hypothetical protein
MIMRPDRRPDFERSGSVSAPLLHPPLAHCDGQEPAGVPNPGLCDERGLQLKVNYRFVPCFTTILPADGSDVLVLALFTDDNPCAEARFQRSGVVYELSTVRH